MNSLKIIIIILGLMVLAPVISAQNSFEVSGVVRDSKGETLIGANVIVKNQPGFGVVTDVNGKYVVKTGRSETLVFSFIGYDPLEIPVEGQSVIDVVLKESVTSLDEVTVVGAGVQRKASVVGAITTVDVKSLKMPTANLSNMLAGNVAGIIAVQRSGEPGENKSEFWIRGISTFGANAGALVLVDGIEREFNEVNPEDIESFSVLKDASATAIYGQRGANGVVLITTKKGTEGKVKINFKAEYGNSASARVPEYVEGMRYSAMANEARMSRYQDPLYDKSDLEIIEYHLDPDLYPNVDWYDEVLKKSTSSYRAMLNISGGGSTARYYLSGAYYNEGGLYKTSSLNDYNTNANYTRYNFRLNLDVNITKTTILEAGIGGWVVNKDKPGAIADDIWGALSRLTPTTVPVRYSNGLWPTYGKEKNQMNPYILLTQTGYQTRWENKMETNIGLRQDLEFVTPGLKFIGRFSYDAFNWHQIDRLKLPALYKAERVRDAQGQLIVTRMVDEEPLHQNTDSYGERRYYGELNLSYDRLFAEKHRVGALLFYYQQENMGTDSGENVFKSVPKRNLALSGRATYAYDDRYFIEFNFGYTGSENFEPGERFGFFPAIAGGWMISNERLVKDHLSWLNLFKIRYSYGEVGNDRIGGDARFPYVTEITNNGDYQFGNQGANGMAGIGIKTLGAKNLTWEVAKKHNLGVDLGLWDRFTLTLDFFKDRRDKIFIRRAFMPGTVGLEGDGQRPWGNVGKMQNKGLDGTFAYNQQLGQLALTIRGNLTYARTKVLDSDEAVNSRFYQMNKGYRLNQNRGLIALGLFKSEAEIASSPKQYGAELLPGDIKYKDVDGNGVINDYDAVPIGYTRDPGLIYGMGLSAMWKGFDFNILFQGSGNSDFLLGGPGVFPFQQNDVGNILKVAADPSKRWISREISGDPATERTDAIFPRLTYGDNVNNYKPSTFWLRNARFLRLKNLEVGYTLPRHLTRKWLMEGVRIYLIGYNLAVWDKFGWWDPELGSSDGAKYPIQRNFTVGLTFNL